MSTEMLERAFASTRSVLVNVRPDQFDLPTPCASWNVRALVNHVVRGPHFFAATVEAGEAVRPADVDYTEGDVVASYDDGAALAVAAFGAPGALEKVITVPVGRIPGAVFIGIASTDVFGHGWDLARATGQSSDLDPKLAAQLLERARTTLHDTLRGPDGQAPFGPRVEPPTAASAADALAAFLGRKV